MLELKDWAWLKGLPRGVNAALRPLVLFLPFLFPKHLKAYCCLKLMFLVHKHSLDYVYLDRDLLSYISSLYSNLQKKNNKYLGL